MEDKIILFDPSLKDHFGNNSINLGDVIIYESASKYLHQLFPNLEIIRISTHSPLEKKHIKLASEVKLKFIGGTNILSSDIKKYNQWKLSSQKFYYYFPKISNVVPFGVGWWQYQPNPTFTTNYFYKKILHKNFLISVRDDYTRIKMNKMGFKYILNTSCPTTWELNNHEGNRKNKSNNCLFSLTDYYQDRQADTDIIKVLLEYFPKKLYFFPQGTLDKDYIESLDIFKLNKSRIVILERTIQIFNEILNEDITYIGTRLHGGIKCLQNSIDTLIIAVDNRATEIGKDINLPVVKRGDTEILRKWLEGDKIFAPIKLPIEAINLWKNQFQNIK
jgi:polysaccharide pyruvyl transferase WcaK-like protein